MNDYVFEQCCLINDLINSSKESEARNELIKLLDYHQNVGLAYSPIVNHLIRETGLYPYIQPESANWDDRFVSEVYKVDVGGEEKTLHREQSYLLKRLLNGDNIAVSAPTSFGKSFVIDAFIKLGEPNNVVIIVPTIALADETRRRLQKKFSKKYKIITTVDVELSEKNILIFPQERSFNYIDKLDCIDILIIDEFYKAGVEFDPERAPVLLKAIIELGKKAKQRYFLGPNISEIKKSQLIDGMEFIPLNFNTVFSQIHDVYTISGAERPNDDFKSSQLIEILNKKHTKSLIYAGTFENIDVISNVLNDNLPDKKNEVLDNFSDWLKINYSDGYILSDMVKKGVGIHNGRLHRSLSQIQIRLFEEDNGLDNIISTSSIIEGVNTATENVIIWANKNGRPKLNDFTYKNIIGRGGRMFKHFVGQVYLLEAPPPQESTQLSLDFTDDLVCSLDKDYFSGELTREQEIKIIAFNEQMDNILGQGVYSQIVHENLFQTFSPRKLQQVAIDMKDNPNSWIGLSHLNSLDPNEWDYCLYSVLNSIGNVGSGYKDMVAFIKVISHNWNTPIPKSLSLLRGNGVTVEKFFDMERSVSFKVSSMLKDVSLLYKYVYNRDIDISPFISKLSNVFLPKLVYELEEYGLPRMLSKKIQLSGIFDFEDSNITIHEAINHFNQIGIRTVISGVKDLHPFENYILNYFYEGIQNEQSK